ncbi:DNA-3-methyladenine glycosylase 2 family protein [Cellulomonas endometrii]|uniref:DNA-3-methyladenine glycosylase 2 family protein n=1 Tax=Cellulomonas endometrii TaxID=3036301 RepID=UPI0024ACF1BD|nr:AlkA N-terminal domain-containing protein [Cellulomonas endometrii]
MSTTNPQDDLPTWIDRAVAYRAVSGRDPRYDGRLYLGVTSTGVYCRPSCPARTPRQENCRYFRSAAAAVAAGFRACRRCRPDALPGSREWDARADLAAQALRAIALGVVDEVGVDGLAARLHVSSRHLQRVVVAEMGAGPAQIARSRRAQLARHLLDETALPMADVAFAAGFASVRQFNDVMRATFGAAPRDLRRRRGAAAAGTAAATSPATGTRVHAAPGDDGDAGADARPPVDRARLALHLRHRPPFDAAAWFAHVERRAVAGLEAAEASAAEYRVRRLVPAPHGPAGVTARLARDGARVDVELELGSLADLAPTVARVRRWLDLDADPALVDAALADDPDLAPLVARRPGLRVPGTVDGYELAVRAVLGQQVSVEAARTLTARLVAAHGAPGPAGADGLRAFPRPDVLAAVGVDGVRALGLTGSRATTVVAVARAAADGLLLDPAADRDRTRAQLLALPGVGPWTAEYVALRALGDPDAFPDGDLVLRRAVGRYAPVPGGGEAPSARAVRDRSQQWRPWRGYAAQHLWTAMAAEAGEPGTLPAAPAAAAAPVPAPVPAAAR